MSSDQHAFAFEPGPDMAHGYLYVALNKEMLWVKPGKSNTVRTLAGRARQYTRMGYHVAFQIHCPAHIQREENLHQELVDERAAGHEYYRPTPTVIAATLDAVDAAIHASPTPDRYTRDRARLATALADMYRRYMAIKMSEEL